MVLKESVVPEVGPFYVIDNTIFADTEYMKDLETNTVGCRDSANTHYDFWRILQSLYPELRDKSYDYYPRGRVVYNVNKGTYYLYIDKCLNNIRNIKEIISELNLPMKKVKVDFDEHYQCHNCNKEYVDISENYDMDYSGDPYYMADHDFSCHVRDNY